MKSNLAFVAIFAAVVGFGQMADAAQKTNAVYTPSFLKKSGPMNAWALPTIRIDPKKALSPLPKKSVVAFTLSRPEGDRNELYAVVYRGEGDYLWHRIASERDAWPTRYQGPQVSAQNPDEWTRSVIDEAPAAVVSGDSIHVFSRSDKMVLHWRCDRAALESAGNAEDVTCSFRALNPVRILAVDTVVDGCVSAVVDPSGNVHVVAREGMYDLINPIHPQLLHWTIPADGSSTARLEEVRARNVVYGEDAVSPEACPAVVYNDNDEARGLQIYARGPFGDLTVWFTAPDGWRVRQYRDYPDRVPGGLDGRGNGRIAAVFSAGEGWPHVFFHKDSPAFSGGREEMVHAWGFGTLDPDFDAGAVMQKLEVYGEPERSGIDLSPTAVATGTGNIHAFALAGNGLLYHQRGYLTLGRYSLRSQRYEGLGIDTAPAAVRNGRGKVLVFARRDGRDLAVVSTLDGNGNPLSQASVESLPIVDEKGGAVVVTGFPAVVYE